ncbi:hypothetical protein [Desulfosporosinus sp. BICA1-9]|uniref:hypothetical protein n=1 Tax=Desulfosporosinus sp. BICA1-9 TaxID=1531958 RepID=UPI00054C091C|nr:hypothetical protein [Desulfosporosinus sp. BICA1-9]KJS50647.1 MAG: hypothetical protein VR66_01695 [Peptococcaceae bacterium BRH_c23]KJS88841.1 MAG: hypothetical protein JL57_10470 [Desulfosporosinus sp. BICA1-9]HBW37740.1 hypothetical protein [Desulfosporosinus sp.]
MTQDLIGFKENLKRMIDIVYAGTSNALAVADQLTFLWSVFLLADDSPKPLNYPFKKSLSFTWSELLAIKHDAYDLIQEKILPRMLSRHPVSSYVPKRMAGGGEKLTITPAQCYELMGILNDIYYRLDVVRLNNARLNLDIMLYDYMLEMLFEGSIEGKSEWMTGGSVNFIVSLASFHLMRSGGNDDTINVHDVHCRSGQLLTASFKEFQPINPRTSLFAGRTLSPIMTRIATFRFLLSGVRRFSILKKNPLVFPHDSFSVGSPKEIGNWLKYDVVYVHPPKSITTNHRKASDSRLLGLTGTSHMYFSYLLYGLSKCKPRGWMFAILPEKLLKDEGNWLLDQIWQEAKIKAVIHLPDEQKRSSNGEEFSLIVLRNEPLPGRQNMGDIRRFQLSGYEDWQTTLFWDDYKAVGNGGASAAISDLTGFVEVRRPDQNQLKLDELLFESISRLEDEMVNPRDSRPDGEKLQDWQVTLYRHGTNFDIGQSLQRLICDNRVEAVVSEEGEVVFELKRTDKRTEFEPKKLEEILSLEQFQLFLIICDSESPIPIHKARQKLSQEEQSRFTIQQAVDTVHMIGRMGLLECIYESVNTGIASTAAIGAIDLWMKVPEGERLWKFTASR